LNRLATIDILRALTMVLMIFVNDLWSLTGIPLWLEHVQRGVDGIGLADVVFPAFLFIVGLSIPYAMENRRRKGDSQWQLYKHVLLRAFALIVMGVFLVNGESINESATGMNRLAWNSICCTCFIILWNNYPSRVNAKLVMVLKTIDVIILCVFAYIYRGGTAGEIRFAPQWWGILGLIGWAYLGAASIAVIAKQRLLPNVAGWIFFSVLSIFWHAGLVPSALHFIPEAILGGTLTALVSGGICVSLVVQHYRRGNEHLKLIFLLSIITIALTGLSIITRPYFGLAKLGATPAWLFLCGAFTIIGFMVVYLINEVAGKRDWFNFINPAGTNTLLCYLIPYFAYAFTGLLGIHLPAFFLVGIIGLLKCFLFALLCVFITGRLGKVGITLKL